MSDELTIEGAKQHNSSLFTPHSSLQFPFLVVDIETTGLSFKQNEIIEIGAVRFNPDGTTEEFAQFIKPTGEVPLFIYKLTHITEEQLRSADKAKTVFKDFYHFIKPDDIIVCHNADFDIPFLNYHLFEKIKERITNPVLDTLVLSRIFTPFLKSHNLTAMTEYFQIPLDNAHRAIYDAQATGQLLHKLTDFITEYIKPEEISFLVTVLEYVEKDKGLGLKGKGYDYLNKTKDHLLTYLILLRNYMIKFALTKKQPKESPFNFNYYNYVENKTSEDRPQSSGVQNIQHSTIDEVFSSAGAFSRTFENYELREGQIQMAKAIQHAFENDEFLLVEAGTGVGKSLAYLVPALFFSQKTGKKVFISTNTKNLQEQLLYKDIPLLVKALNLDDSANGSNSKSPNTKHRAPNTDFSAVLVKGRDNYLCLRKWQELYEAFTLRQANINIAHSEAFGILYLYLWAINTKTGDINENPSFLNTPYQSALRRISSDRHLCLGRKCRHYSNCFLMEVREKAEKANIIIVNHSLLFADLQMEKPTLGDIEYLVLDEAHNLLSSASEYLGFTLSYPDINGFLNTIHGIKRDFQTGMMINLKNACLKSTISKTDKELIIDDIDKLQNYMDESKEIVEKPFIACGEIAKNKGSYNKIRVRPTVSSTPVEGGGTTRTPNTEHRTPTLTPLKDYLHKIATSLRKLRNTIMVYEAQKFADQGIMLDFLEKSSERLNGFIKQLDCLIDPDFDKYAFWYSTMEVKVENYPDGIYNYAPISVDNILPDIVYRRMKSMVFTSATLSLRGRFKYFITNMGLEKTSEDRPQTSEISTQITRTPNTEHRIPSLIVPSPFNYDTQTVVINTSYLPPYTDPYFAIQSAGLIKAIIERKPVGTLALFTSKKDLTTMYESLEQACFEKDILLLAQDISGSRGNILNRFKEDGKAILLGTSSFWEGVDVLGDSLSLLIVYKLPFAVPSEPIVEAYLEKLAKEGKDSFMHHSIPNALLRMRQGIGRLIRSKTDKGAILILDNRISTKQYGQYFREIIPTRVRSTTNPVETIDYIFEIL